MRHRTSRWTSLAASPFGHNTHEVDAMSPIRFALSLSLLALQVSAQQRADDSTRAPVDRAFAQWNRTDSPGCALGVSRGGSVVYEKGYGMANLEDGVAISPTSIFHVASVSKQFTAMATMLLVRDGK